MDKERFILQPSREQGFWVATDKENGIVITFREHQFNETQKITLLNENTFSSTEQAMKLPTYLREIADWLRAEHYSVAMPSLEIQRERIGQSIRNIRMQRNFTQAELARQAGITQSNLARIEAGKYSVGLDILNKIANALGVEFSVK